MICPECSTEMRKDVKKWLGAVIGLQEKTFALYYCTNKACRQYEKLVCRNTESDKPFEGPFTEEYIELIEDTYA